MKTALIVFLLVIIAGLLTVIYLLFQPNAEYRASRPTLEEKHAAVGRAVIDAAQRDPAVAAIMRAAVHAAREEDRVLAADVIATFPER